MRRIVVADFSGLEKYLDDDKSHVKIPVTDCLLVDDCAHSVYQTLAIVKAGGRMLLLGKCGTGTPGYVYGPTEMLMELPYTSLEEALADTHWDELLKKEVREIDGLAYNLYCDLYR